MTHVILSVGSTDEVCRDRTRILHQGGFAVIEAQNEADMLRIAAEERPALILLDAALPGTNGLTVCNRLKSNPVTAPIPVLKIESDLAKKRRGQEPVTSEADGFVTEPISSETLTTCVSALIRAAAAEEGSRVTQQEVESRLRLAQRAARSGVWTWNVNTGELFWSEEVYDLFGFDAAAVPSMEAWLSAVKPDHRSKVEADMQRAMEGKCQFHSEFPILRYGEVRWIEAIGNFTFDSQSTAVQVAGIGFDVTERKHMEGALRESEERFRMATQAANEAIWELDVASGSVSWSENFTRFYGRTQDGGSSIGWWLNRLHSEDRERVVSSLNSALSGTATSWDCEYRFRKPDDSWATIYDRALIARTVDGKATRVIGAMLDTTELHVTRQQLKVLSGLLPICAVCKKIRDGDGTWHVMESYIHTHSEAKFSHGLCPECVTTWYGSENDASAAP